MPLDHLTTARHSTVKMEGYRQTAIWFADNTSLHPYFTNLTHAQLKEKMEAEYQKIVVQGQDIPECHRGGRGNQYGCEGAYEYIYEIEYRISNFYPEEWVEITKPKNQRGLRG